MLQFSNIVLSRVGGLYAGIVFLRGTNCWRVRPNCGFTTGHAVDLRGDEHSIVQFSLLNPYNCYIQKHVGVTLRHTVDSSALIVTPGAAALRCLGIP